ncbi:hypothetical protein HY837_06750 [archaeon]|nr:hypothetical protein [archaeon]
MSKYILGEYWKRKPSYADTECAGLFLVHPGEGIDCFLLYESRTENNGWRVSSELLEKLQGVDVFELYSGPEREFFDRNKGEQILLKPLRNQYWLKQLTRTQPKKRHNPEIFAQGE